MVIFDFVLHLDGIGMFGMLLLFVHDPGLVSIFQLSIREPNYTLVKEERTKSKETRENNETEMLNVHQDFDNFFHMKITSLYKK